MELQRRRIRRWMAFYGQQDAEKWRIYQHEIHTYMNTYIHAYVCTYLFMYLTMYLILSF